MMTAPAEDITLTAATLVDDAVTIEADRRILAAVMMNLLQNASKFTRPHTTVTRRVGASDERVHRRRGCPRCS